MYDLIDYKGKFDIIQDPSLFIDDPMEYKCGEISKEDVFRQLPQRHDNSRYYGVPCYIGTDSEILRVVELLDKEYENKNTRN